MAYGDLKVRNLIWNTGSGDNTIVTSTLATSGANTYTGNQSLGDNLKVQFGASNDLEIYHSNSGNDSFIDNNKNKLYIRCNVDGDDGGDIHIQAKSTENSARFVHDGAVELYYDGSKKFETTSAGIATSGSLAFTSASNGISLLDNGKVKFGNGDDLQIYHDGSNSFIADAGAGNLHIRASDNLYLARYGTNENMVVCKGDGAVELYYDNVKKLATASGGTKTTGLYHLVSNPGASAYIEVGQGATDNQYAYLDLVGDTTYSDYGLRLIRNNTGANTSSALYHRGTGALNIVCVDNAELRFLTNNSLRWRLESGGDLRNASDSYKLKFGASDDLQIYHNGNNSVIADNGTGNLSLQTNDSVVNIWNSTDAAYIAQFIGSGAVQLYYDGGTTPKLETTSGGIKVTGDLALPTANRLYFGNSDVSWIKGEHGASGYLEFGVNSAHMTINRSGRVLVGTSTAAPNGGDGYIQAKVAGASLGAWLSDTGTSSTRLHMRFTNPQGVIGSISTNSSSTSFNTTSDYRLKENEVAISDGITRLKTLKPYRFNFKTDSSTTVDGFFAHEVTPAVPEAITGEKDGTEMQAIDQSKLVPLLTAALQEAITKIETLETKVAVLEG